MRNQLSLDQEERCRNFGFDPEEVASLARSFSRLGRKARSMGIEVFGGSGSGTLRPLGAGGAQNVLADIDGYFDGGDGGDEF